MYDLPSNHLNHYLSLLGNLKQFHTTIVLKAERGS